MPEVVAAEASELGLTGVVQGQIIAGRPEGCPTRLPDVASEEVRVEGLAVAVEH
jgi:hypothetical protein